MKKSITLDQEVPFKRKIDPKERVYLAIKKAGKPLTRVQIMTEAKVGSGGSLSGWLKYLIAEGVIKESKCPYCNDTVVYSILK